MKTTKQKICGSLLFVIAVAVFSAVFFGLRGQHELTDSEMAMIRGAKKCKAVCMDMCGNQGSESTCTSTPDNSCALLNTYPCNNKYRTSSGGTPDDSLYFCSYKPSASKIDCYKRGPDRVCHDFSICVCYHHAPRGYYCDVHEYGEYTVKDECGRAGEREE